MKTYLTTPPVLAQPADDATFILDCDASDNALGAVLSIVEEGQEKVVAYGSKSLSATQKTTVLPKENFWR